jgi:hypothetical protein
MFQDVHFCTVLYDCNFYVLEIKIIKNSTKNTSWNIKNIEIEIIKNRTKINFLEHKEHSNYNHKEQYKNELPGT